ncbi:TRAP transporter substrate-binding protein [Cuneatibacter sp. NSJ-177]|uniref:TRAP transporter substrate-binding protein n=1 Tax=Cuneatibacter sp. NSJ-177 TaxID=2931401 RepID=UPI001FD3440F|nr:TRAP transporter substrate-binding protein [Cuneatibacter sp. NSJ-177]MCJ7834440.1 TRAP transporter substrate-binding protein [Cuneatibacter sp. NSJ-177]
MKKLRNMMAAMMAVTMAVSLTACGSGSSGTTTAAAGSATTAAESAGSGSQAPSADAEYNFNISVDASDDETISKYAQKLKEELESRSGGRIAATVYTNGTLGGDDEALQSCADGSLAVVLSTTAPQVNFMPELAMFDLPNLFTDITQFRALFDNEEFVTKLNEIYTNGGFKLLGIADSGFRVMSSNIKVEKLEDMSGIKIRTMKNSNHIAIWQAYGANPTPMAFGEVYIGLQQKTIDAQENPIEVLVSSKFYEQQKYVILTNHLPHACVCLMSGDIYGELPEDLQKVVEEAGQAATEYTRDLSDKQNSEQLEFLKGQGVEVVTLSDETLASLKDATQSVYDMIKDQIGEDMMNLMLNAAGK